mgnify:CR=1 FL=1
MNFRFLSALVFGVFGVALLCGLGVWQVQRMHWKNALLADINARIGGTPVAVPAMPDPEADRYRPVQAEGRFTGEHLYVLSGQKEVGAGVRVIPVLQTTHGRRILVDRGFLAEDDKASISAWLAAGQVNALSAAQAEDLLARDPPLWAVVVAPWVLVQERTTATALH